MTSVFVEVRRTAAVAVYLPEDGVTREGSQRTMDPLTAGLTAGVALFPMVARHASKVIALGIALRRTRGAERPEIIRALRDLFDKRR
ncbi:hypothetical protein [Streptomyces mutabilis]|uniref:hypothetical protein n=1 Tax=Streptomyces mutabilis TaxID=67332 RepID=UPI003416FCA6